MFFSIFLEIIAPIFVIIGIGYLVAKKMTINIDSLSKFNFYIFAPALVFVKLSTTEFEWSLFGKVTIFSILLAAVLLLITFILAKTNQLFYQHRKIISLGTLFFNAGNYGIPLLFLSFGEQSLPIITVVLMFQNLISFSFGIILLRSGHVQLGEIIKNFVKIPILYAIILGVIIKYFNIDLREYKFIYEPLNYLSNGLVPVALLTLGCQMSVCKLSKNLLISVGITNILKLIISPIIALIIVRLLNFDEFLSDALILASALPTATNVFILALEYKQDEELASQVVFASTIISSITISIIIIMLKLF